MFGTTQCVSVKRVIAVFHVIITLAVFFHIVCASRAEAQENCETVVTEAQSLYEIGRTAEMIVRLKSCLPDGIPEQVQRVQAYRLLSLAYIEEVQLSEAEDTVEKLLDLNENFEPDPTIDPSNFIEFVEASKEVRAQAQAKKSRKKRWLYIGGGTVLAGAVTAAIIVATGGSEPRPRLPDPPPYPENQ
jgi:hypothetical protein